MTISSDGAGSSLISVLPAVSAANTAAATSGWIDCAAYKGDLVFIVNTGAVTGSMVGKLQSATDSGGTGAADITGATHTSISTANQTRKIVIPATTARYIAYIGTVTTGPILVSVTLQAHPGTL